ncbi:glycosyltransferase family 2 protein [Prevotella sp. tf2-5]|uniref:glycosyltransferase family 2 protein n=1 Tax=Prevotella sp. tf2-5 TaxID=1761889 RepID=UPI0008E39710|nr:glycosyltransferase family 2 protein [Prevotella sp. tf2-5]SFP03319.1 Glycosyltransferase involved in cell wall bisynthesis [Prevotella sp. tf2-5]
MEQQKGITISIIIPVYNVSAYIERCLRSVIKQTYDHFECILVDDASPDDSIAKCERMIADYDGPIQFRIIHHEHNRGLSAARNTGTDAATGDYILYVDSDDIISNDCVEKLMAPVLNDNSIEMVLGKTMRFSDEGLSVQTIRLGGSKKIITSHEEVRNTFFDKKHLIPYSAWNRMISREFINKHHLRFEEGKIWEEILWTFFAMKDLSHIYIIPDFTYFYYQRPDSICGSSGKEVLSSQKCIVYDIISMNFTPDDEGREAAYYVRDFIRNYMRLRKAKDLRATAQRFSKALPFRKYPKEKTLLWAAMLLPHNHWGKEIYKFIVKTLKK